MRDDDLHETLRAIRELASASCHLANLAARLTRGSQDPEAIRATAAALRCSTLAAESAFALDDAFRADMDPAAVLWISLETLETTQAAVRSAREAVESALSLVMNAPQPRASR